ncbi:hypothetical protein DW687_04875 [Anaerofustis stercorihominis]|uniref:Uncharacterized protein n=1 Tax=Anaerofustis stercorihominis TaxID=214853 RepID=A0A3E3DXW2_9FIRM|nr:hypothetical protein DW687_04875 [Anaerofustis stercorihominis]
MSGALYFIFGRTKINGVWGKAPKRGFGTLPEEAGRSPANKPHRCSGQVLKSVLKKSLDKQRMAGYGAEPLI